MLETHPQTLKVVFKHYPLTSIHKYALPAAVAAEAAGNQGKFWEYHDALFEHHNDLNEQRLRQIAERLGLDIARFEADRKAGDTMERIERDYREGRRLGIRGVPSVFVNGLQQRRWSKELLEASVAEALKGVSQKTP